MKYFKKFSDLNEKLERDSDINILGIFSSLFSSIGKASGKRRLRLIAKSYDNYLMITYKLYISNKKLNIPEDKVDTFNFSDLNKTINIKPVSKDTENIDIDVNEDLMDDLMDDGHIKNDSSINLKLNALDYNKIEDIEDIDYEDIQDDTESNSNKELPEYINSNEKDNDITDNDTPKNLDGDKEFITYLNNMSKDDRRMYYHKIMTDHSNAITNLKQAKKVSDDNDRTIGKYSSGRQRMDAIKNNELLDKKIIKLEELIANTEWEMKEIIKNFPNLKIVKESKEWTNPNSTWSSDDSENLTSLINPYKINEFSLQANLIIENSNDKNKSSFNNYWSILKNEIHKRWYYTYDIKSLESGIKLAKIEYNKKSTEEKKYINNSMSINMVLKEKFNKDIRNYTSPYYAGLKNVTEHYYILNIDSRLFILNKIDFIKNKSNKNIFLFKIIGNLKINKDKKFYVDELLNNEEENMVMSFSGKDYILYKKPEDFPVVVIKGSMIYSLPVKGRSDNSFIDLTSISIGSLNYKASKDMLSNVKTEDLNHSELSDNEIEIIKNINIK